jgi:hypothetical protein
MDTKGEEVKAGDLAPPHWYKGQDRQPLGLMKHSVDPPPERAKGAHWLV